MGASDALKADLALANEVLKNVLKTTLADGVKKATPMPRSRTPLPPWRFYLYHQDALSYQAKQLKQQVLDNKVVPRIDALEAQKSGDGYAYALMVHEQLRAAARTR